MLLETNQKPGQLLMCQQLLRDFHFIYNYIYHFKWLAKDNNSFCLSFPQHSAIYSEFCDLFRPVIYHHVTARDNQSK